MTQQANGNGEARAQLAAIRQAVVRVMGPDAHIPESTTTAELVQMLIAVSTVTHQQGQAAVRELQAVVRVLVEAGADATLPAVEQVQVFVKAQGPVQMSSLPAEAVERLFREAIEKGTLKLSKGAAAGMSEALTGESGAVELALTMHELTDLFESGAAFTEVGGGSAGSPDVLVKLVDTTGRLQALAKTWRVMAAEAGGTTH